MKDDLSNCEAVARHIFGTFGYPVNNAPLTFASIIDVIAKERANAAAQLAEFRACLVRLETLFANPVRGELTERERYALLDVRDVLKAVPR